MSARIRHGGALAALISLQLAALSLPARAQVCTPRPSVAWNTYLGDIDADEVEDIVASRSKDGSLDAIYVTGRTSSSRFPGAQNAPFAPNQNAFVSKLNADGTRVEWTRVFGTEGMDSGMHLALGLEGEVYVVGRVEGVSVSVDNASSVSTVQSASAKGDGFLARLSAKGDLGWFLFLGGPESDVAQGVAVEGSKVYVVGRTESDSLTFSGNTKKFGNPGTNGDGFILQVEVSGATPVPAWYRQVGTKKPLDGSSTGDDAAFSVLARAGTLYVGGVVRGDLQLNEPFFIIKGAYTKGSTYGFVMSLKDSGDTVNWFSYLGGEGNTQVRALLQRRANENLIAVGDTNAKNFPGGGTSSLSTFDVFVQAVTSTDGTPTSDWAWRMDVPGEQRVQGAAALDAAEQLYLGGTTLGRFDEGLLQRGFNASPAPPSDDGFVLALNLARPREEQVLWGAYVGGNSISSESVRALALDGTGTRLLLGGASSASDLLLAKTGAFTTAPASVNGFVFGVVFDATPPVGGQVVASIDTQQHLTATWRNFQDEQSNIAKYEWSIVDSSGQTLLEFTRVEGDYETATNLKLQEGQRYTVQVSATNGAGCSTVVASRAVGLNDKPNEPGTDPEPGSPAEGNPRSPLGWGCGSTSSGAPLQALGLLLLGLLGSRWTRRARVRWDGGGYQ